MQDPKGRSIYGSSEKKPTATGCSPIDHTSSVANVAVLRTQRPVLVQQAAVQETADHLSACTYQQHDHSTEYNRLCEFVSHCYCCVILVWLLLRSPAPVMDVM